MQLNLQALLVLGLCFFCQTSYATNDDTTEIQLANKKQPKSYTQIDKNTTIQSVFSNTLLEKFSLEKSRERICFFNRLFNQIDPLGYANPRLIKEIENYVKRLYFDLGDYRPDDRVRIARALVIVILKNSYSEFKFDDLYPAHKLYSEHEINAVKQDILFVNNNLVWDFPGFAPVQ